MLRNTLLAVTALMLAAAAFATPLGTLTVEQLRCEYLDNPLGLDVAEPRLSWILEGRGLGAMQTAYQVQAADSALALDTGSAFWDTGKVTSDQSIQVAWGGRALQSRERVYWRVRVWDGADVVSPWSEPAWFEMGLLSPADWDAAWIEEAVAEAPPALPNLRQAAWVWHPEATGEDATVYFRAGLTLPETAEVRSALVQLAVDNEAQLFLNGREVCRAQGWQQARQFTVTEYLRGGRNTVAVRAHNTNAGAGLLAALKVELADGTRAYLATGPSWRVTDEAPAGWESAEADLASWRAAKAVAPWGGQPWGEPTVVDGDPQPAPLFRRTFTLDAQVAKARAYVCGLGYHEFHVNGEKVGDHVLEPAQTDYQARAFYVTHDITKLLKRGENALGLWLGDGWFDQSVVWGGMSYGAPCAIAQVEVTFQDGSVRRIGTDTNWRAGHGPVLSNNVYAGEFYDARREVPGWSAPGFDDASWLPAAERPSPTAALRAQLMPGIRAVETMRPVAVTEPEAGVYIVDMGQNFSGWARLSVRGEAGDRVRMRFAEALTPDGRLDPRSTGVYATNLVQTDTYVCKGGGLETWEPRFTYHGFRYVELTGCPEPPNRDTLRGVVVHTDVAPAGAFACSDPLLNRIHETALWTQRSNLHGIPTDCPHRERCGWLGDAHVAAEMTIFNYDMARFWTKYLRDIQTSLIDGVTPTYVAPGKRTCGAASHDWATALYQLPWYLYVYYGDRAALEEHFDSGVRWLDRVRETQLDDNLILQGADWHVGLGDWCPPGGNGAMDTPVPLTSTAYVFFDHVLMSSMADILGKPDEARFFANFAARQREAFNDAFYDAENHTYGSQTANVLALYMGLVPDGDAERVAERLAFDVRETAAGHHTTGIMGSRYLFGELSRFGHGNEAVGILQNEDYPSIGWLFKLGATTLWESWGQELTPGGEMPRYSLSHPMQGGFDAWFYDGLCGIQPDPAHPGFKHFFIRPSLVGNLKEASAEFDSPHGTIRSAWTRSATKVYFDITVPANSTATVTLPGGDFASLNVNGQRAESARGVLETNAQTATLRVGSGRYRLSATIE